MSQTKPEIKFKTGWIPDRPDFRDWLYDIKKLVNPKPLSNTVDLRDKMPAPVAQGNLGSCSAFAIGAMLEYNRIQENQVHFWPSPLFIYYNARAKEGTINLDCGCYIRTAIKSVATEGATEEILWPYKIEKFKIKPSKRAYEQALNFKAIKYFRLDNTKLNDLKTCLNEGETFVFGSTVYESFFKANFKGGIVEMPKKTEKEVGGHAMLCVGYEDDKQRFIIRNSWGAEVGDGGYFYMPYDYLTSNSLTDDCWTVKTTT